MAGTLTISTLSDGTNSTSSTNCIQGSAKAWINYKGTTTQSIRASYNVSSVTYNGTGDYTINMTNALTDTNYALSALAGRTSTNATNLCIADMSSSTPRTTSSFRVNITTGSGPAYESEYIGICVFR